MGHRVHKCCEWFNRNIHDCYNENNFSHLALWQVRNQQPQLQAYYTNTFTSLEALSTSSWYLDSGDTHHITPKVINLRQSFPYLGSNQLHISNGQGLMILSSNDSHLVANWRMFKLRNILYVQKLTSNNDVIIEFHYQFCLVKDPTTEEELFYGMVKDGLYHLYPSQLWPSMLVSKWASPNTWHIRVGNLHFHILQTIIAKNNLPITH